MRDPLVHSRMTDGSVGPRPRGSGAFLTDFLLAGTAAAISKTFVSPVERVRALVPVTLKFMSVEPVSVRPTFPTLYAFAGTVRRVVAEQGVLALWRGNSINALRYFHHQSLNFAFKDKFSRMLGTDAVSGRFLPNAAAGAAAGAASLLLTYPLDNAQTILVTGAKAARVTGTCSGVGDVFRRAGLTRLYRGFAASCLGAAVFRSVYFGAYDSLKPTLLTGAAKDSFAASLLLGYSATLTANLASYPVDTVRRNVMLNAHRSATHALSQILQTAGPKVLFKGAGSSLPLRSVTGAATLAGFDALQAMFQQKRIAKADSNPRR